MKRLYYGIGQGYQADGTPIRHHELMSWRQAAYQRISETFGGMTTVNVMGGWISPTNGLVRERSWGIEIYTDSHTVESARAIAEWLKSEFRQESVLVVVSPVDSVDFV